MAVVTPTDRLKWVRNRFVIDVLVAFFADTLLFDISCECRSYFHTTESDLLKGLAIEDAGAL